MAVDTRHALTNSVDGGGEHFIIESIPETDYEAGEYHEKPSQPWRQRWSSRALVKSITKRGRALYVWIFLGTSSVLLGIAIVVWLALINTLLSRLAPAALGNGVETVVKNWRSSGDAQKIIPWPADFSRDVIPVQCHSHNDYWRKVPLFDALAAGCVSVEADIWNEQGSDELLVGHSKRALKAERTLRSLYLDPIMHILKATNNGTSANETVGVFETAPNTTLVLLLDFKTDGANTWPLVQTHLEPLREKEWLTRWDATTKSRRLGLVTVVATGKAPFDLVTSSTTKDIFFDAPLDNLDKTDQYTAENSYFASVSMGKAIGNVRHDLSVTQLVQVEKQISLAEQKALVSRYWDTPSWPMSTRNRVWQTLVDHGVGILNVDSLETATRWDWKICSVGGLRICG